MARRFARDVVRLLDHLKIQRAHVLGYSLGAFIAGRLATMHPERLISVIYVAGLPLRDVSFMDTFAAESVKELESDLPFKSLVVALQPPGVEAAVRRRDSQGGGAAGGRERREGLRRAVARLQDARRDRRTAGSGARSFDRDHRQRQTSMPPAFLS